MARARNNADRLMSVEQVATMLGVSRRTVWRWSAEQPEFPKPAVLGSKLTRWRAGEVQHFARLSMGESSRRAQVARRRFRPHAANDRQMAFARHYAESGNATRAAIAAGYSARSAATIGYENLRRPAVRIQLAKEKESRVRRPEKPSKADILAELDRIYRADIGAIFNPDDSLKPVAEWPFLVRNVLVRKWKVKRIVRSDASGVNHRLEFIDLDFHDRFKVLKMKGNHTDVRAFEPDTSELRHLKDKLAIEELKMIVLGSERDECKEAYEKLKAETGRAKPA